MCRWLLLGIMVLGTVAAVWAKPPRGYDSRYYGKEVRPVADKIWISTTGDMNAVGSYSPAGVPGNGDSLSFPGSAFGGSDHSATVNTDALAGVTLAQVLSYPTYPGDIGTVAAPAEVGDVSTTSLVHQGSGTWYIGRAVSWACIDSPNAVLAAEFAVTNSITDVRGGHVVFRAGASVSRLGVMETGPSVTSVELKGTTTTFANVQMSGGFARCERDQVGASTLVLNGGTWVQGQTSTEPFTNAQVAGGTFIYNGTGTLSKCIVLNGAVDFSQDTRAKTVAILKIHPTGDFVTNNNLTIISYWDLRQAIPSVISVSP